MPSAKILLLQGLTSGFSCLGTSSSQGLNAWNVSLDVGGSYLVKHLTSESVVLIARTQSYVQFPTVQLVHLRSLHVAGQQIWHDAVTLYQVTRAEKLLLCSLINLDLDYSLFFPNDKTHVGSLPSSFSTL